MQVLRHRSTNTVIVFDMVGSDNLGIPDLSPSVNLSKNGKPFEPAKGAVEESEQHDGCYTFHPSPDDLDELGSLAFRAYSAGALNDYAEWIVIESEPSRHVLDLRQEEKSAAASSVATWYVAGHLEQRGLYVERLGPVVTVVIDGRTYRISVEADPQ